MQDRLSKIFTKHRPLLERWIMHGDGLVGYIYDSKEHPAGTRVLTDAVRFVDPINRYAECLTESFRLGVPGTFREHQHPLITYKPPANEAEGENTVNVSVFLSPHG